MQYCFMMYKYYLTSISSYILFIFNVGTLAGLGHISCFSFPGDMGSQFYSVIEINSACSSLNLGYLLTGSGEKAVSD